MAERAAEAAKAETPRRSGRLRPVASLTRVAAAPPRGTAAPSAAPPVLRLRPRRPATPPPDAPAPLAQAIRSPGPGQPLPPQVREPLTRTLGVDLEPVRVHTDPGATAAAEAIPARAFAYDTDVFLGRGERATDLPLIAHEVTHVVQQQDRPAARPYTTDGDALEREAQSTATAVQQGGPARVAGSTGGPRVQGWSFGEWVEDKIWGLLERFAPVLVPIIRQGFWSWLTEKITAAVEAVIDTLMAPVRAVKGVIESLSAHFTNLVQWIREAAGKIARGDCSSITEAAQKIQDVITGLAAPVIDQIKEWAGKARNFFVGIWEKVGAPVWDFLKKVGGAIWDTIKDIATWIWEKTEPIRDWLGRAWRWVKNKLGIGEGAEGQNGILQWVQEKAAKAWDWVKAKLEPYKKQIMIVAGVVLAITVGPIVAIAAAGAGIIYGIRWIAQHLRTRGAVLDQRSVLERDVIPKIMGAVNSVTAKLNEIAASLTEKFGAIVGGLGKLAGDLAGSILSFLVSAVNWLIDKFKSLLQWASEKVQAIADWVKTALGRLKTFLEPVLEFIRWIGSVIADVWNLVSGVVKRIWNRIPACIKDPVVNFLINQILKRIPIFSKLVAIKDIWTKLKDGAMNVIRAIFVKWDLKAAVYAVFDLVLLILDIPKQLVMSIYAKARKAWDEIVKDPIEFLKNIFRALWKGFGQFFDKIFTHLWNGVVKWFKGILGAAGIEFPSEFTIGSVIKFLLGILGVTVDKVFAIIEKKTRPGIAATLKRVWRTLTGIWDFVSVAMEKGPAALWEKLKDYASGIIDALIGALVDWATMKIVTVATPRLLSALNPIGAIINAILAAWAAIQTAGQYIRDILAIVDTILDTALELAAGAIGTAANYVENALAAAIPIAIGFLVNFLRFGDLAERIKEMVEKLQAKVEEALEKLVDKALAVGRSVLDALGVGGAGAGERAEFDEGGEHHVISAEGEGEGEEIWVESTRKTAEQHLKDWESGDLPKLPRSSDQQQSRSNITKARNFLTARRKLKTTKLTDLVEPFKHLFRMFGYPTVPKTKIGYGANAVGKWAQARPLTLKFDPAYTPSKDTSAALPTDPRMRQLNLAKDQWVKMHLIHFDLGGPNESWNFTPGMKGANAQMYRDAENPIITLLTSAAEAGKKVLWYKAASAVRGSPNEGFSESVTVQWGEMDAQGKQETGTATSKGPFPSLAPSGGVTTASLSKSSARDLELVGDLDGEYARAVEGAQYARNYRDVDDIIDAVRKKRPLFTDFAGLRRAIDSGIAKGRLDF